MENGGSHLASIPIQGFFLWDKAKEKRTHPLIRSVFQG